MRGKGEEEVGEGKPGEKKEREGDKGVHAWRVKVRGRAGVAVDVRGKKNLRALTGSSSNSPLHPGREGC